MTLNDPTEALAARARNGDTEALGELVEHFRPRLVGLVLSRLRARSLSQIEGDEVVQEVSLRACKAIERFEWQGPDSFLRWLGGIAEHVILDLVRGCVRSRTTPLVGDTPDSVASPSRVLRREERFDRLEKALQQLAPDQRKVVVLARLKKLPIKTIAEAMGRSPDAVSQLLRRAFKNLKELIGETESLRLPLREIDRGILDDAE